MERPLPTAWQKRNRSCNLGLCPAFHLTQQDIKGLEESGKRLREVGDIEQVVAERGVPSGTCLVTGQDRVVNSLCTVDDSSFTEYFENQ